MHTFLTEYFMTNLPADTVRRIEDAAAALIAAATRTRPTNRSASTSVAAPCPTFPR
ncbi:Uncharacterised protein [Citrobacter koseri]|uniref:Uncharacterized protein n=1 Tax=Citrobacter koseri TaxID=545 RepID=A0A447UPU5_CITKO|nr:Uncharacterised protein [Citrobacter koseri]